MDKKTDIRDIFAALVRERDWVEHALRDNASQPRETVRIVFRPRASNEERGKYYPKADPPQVEILRYGCTGEDDSRRAAEFAAEASPDLAMEELIYLAHELGHHEAYLRKLPYVDDEDHPYLDDYDRYDMYEMELWAWLFGRWILE